MHASLLLLSFAIRLASRKVIPRMSDVGEIEIGTFSSDVARETKRSSIVIATFNMRYCVGSFLITGSIFRRVGLKMARRRAPFVAGNLMRASSALSEGVLMPRADIIALQEADKETRRAGGHHVARELAQSLRMSYAHAPANLPHGEEPKRKQWYLDFEEHIEQDDTGTTGVAILSSSPFMEVARLDLPWHECAWRPRLALYARFNFVGRDLHLFNAHIDPHAEADEQLEQHEAILERADRLNGAVVIAGDFNTLSKESCSRMLRFMESRGYSTPLPLSLATWRAGLIRLHPDWIFLRGASATSWGVCKPLSASDHWPVWVEIAFDEMSV